jgi:hypothetical protein
MEFIRRHNEAAAIVFPLLDPNTGNYKMAAPLVGGDCQYVIHSGGAWQGAQNTSVLPVELSNGLYSLELAASELNPDDRKYPVAITIVDQSSTKVWNDDTMLIRFESGSNPQVRISAAYLTTAGTELRILAWVEQDGQIVALTASATINITVYEQGSSVATFVATDGGVPPNNQEVFDITQTNPNLTADRVYYAILAITDGNQTYRGIESFPVFG